MRSMNNESNASIMMSKKHLLGLANSPSRYNTKASKNALAGQGTSDLKPSLKGPQGVGNDFMLHRETSDVKLIKLTDSKSFNDEDGPGEDLAERTIRFDETGSNQFMNSFANNMASTTARQMFSPAPRLANGSALPSLD